MSLQGDLIKVQIFVAQRKLNAIGGHVFSGGLKSRAAQHAAKVIQHRLKKLLEDDNLSDMLRS